MVTYTEYREVNIKDTNGTVVTSGGDLIVRVKGSADLALKVTNNVAEALGIRWLTRFRIESVTRHAEGEYQVKATWGSPPFPG
jgi:hypothetical protein